MKLEGKNEFEYFIHLFNKYLMFIIVGEVAVKMHIEILTTNIYIGRVRQQIREIHTHTCTCASTFYMVLKKTRQGRGLESTESGVKHRHFSCNDQGKPHLWYF